MINLGICYMCGGKTNMIRNCKNDNCHRRMVQCEVCLGKFLLDEVQSNLLVTRTKN
jgi:hypothetical protein